VPQTKVKAVHALIPVDKATRAQLAVEVFVRYRHQVHFHVVSQLQQLQQPQQEALAHGKVLPIQTVPGQLSIGLAVFLLESFVELS